MSDYPLFVDVALTVFLGVMTVFVIVATWAIIREARR